MAQTGKRGAVIGNIIFYCFMVIALICSIAVIVQRKNNAVPKIFGYSHLKILSQSMQQSGFEKGDSVVIKKSSKGYKVGDYIAFYRYADPFNPLPDIGAAPSLGVKNAAKAGAPVWFHEIVEIVTDNDGTQWYRTKGTSNAHPDSGLIRSDFVLGKFVNTPWLVTSFFEFISSVWGIVSLIVIPNGVLLIILNIQLVQFVDEHVKNKKINYRQADSMKKLRVKQK